MFCEFACIFLSFTVISSRPLPIGLIIIINTIFWWLIFLISEICGSVSLCELKPLAYVAINQHANMCQWAEWSCSGWPGSGSGQQTTKPRSGKDRCHIIQFLHSSTLLVSRIISYHLWMFFICQVTLSSNEVWNCFYAST